MIEIEWTDEELREFDKLVDGVSSRNQLTRISAGLDMHRFVAEHGAEKCDAMFAHLEGKANAGK